MAPKAHVSARPPFRLSVALILAALPSTRNDALAALAGLVFLAEGAVAGLSWTSGAWRSIAFRSR